MDCSTPGFPVCHHFLEFAQTHVHWVSGQPSNRRLILCRPLLPLPSIFPSIRVFSSDLALHIWWPKYWTFSLSISPSGLISFRIDWFDLLVVPEILKSLLFGSRKHFTQVKGNSVIFRFVSFIFCVNIQSLQESALPISILFPWCQGIEDSVRLHQSHWPFLFNQSEVHEILLKTHHFKQDELAVGTC